MRRRLARTITLSTALLAAATLATAPAPAAVKLIHMNNGRTLKARAVERQGDWIFAILEGDSKIGFPADAVERIEDDPLGREDLGARTNVVTSGREAGALRPDNSRREAIEAQAVPPPMPPQEPAEGVAEVPPQQPVGVVTGQPVEGPTRFNRLGIRGRNREN
jgi:hypothetical protein